MSIDPQPQFDLSFNNTLGVPARAAWYAELHEASDLPLLVRWAKEHDMAVRALGGGSNLVMHEQVSGLTIKVSIRGKTRIDSGSSRQRWRLGAGESWHETVVDLIEQGGSGVENLALIPGTVGAAPVQNIGAYGVELADCLYRVEAYDTQENQWRQFTREACEFGYRDSVFKQQENRFIITAVELDLDQEFQPRLSYGPLQELANLPDLNARDVLAKVIEVRQSRLPDPMVLPNAGSFFKNPVITSETYSALVKNHPNLVVYAQPGGWKLAAGWLIDQCGLRGQSNVDGVGCYEHQALVLVNPKRAPAASIQAWQALVQGAVLERFGVELEPEPRFWA
ncbi:UDP-N-acetylmuramate dehydrogenase [Saccharospirillum impatiens]|uniref:UDP-N-acetylmuramate dehydrogenase n=1 Tax=Saccharospirillum impatiens TaxID=169438 RepID=UPI000411BD1A|nr:UDP-N-acetylmuramate dehydrogenase [Saccharospirillum impatiens]